MAESTKIGFILFYIAYIALITLMIPAQYITGGEAANITAPEAPADIVTFIFFTVGELFNRFIGLATFSIAVPLLGIFNTIFTAVFIWVLLEVMRGV